jgi:hypothetical protein
MAKDPQKNARKPDLQTLPEPARAYIAAFLRGADPFLPHLRFVRRTLGGAFLQNQQPPRAPKNYSDQLAACDEKAEMLVVREYLLSQSREVQERAFENIMRAALNGISSIEGPGSFYIFDFQSRSKVGEKPSPGRSEVGEIALEWNNETLQFMQTEIFGVHGTVAFGLIGRVVCTEDDPTSKDAKIQLILVNTRIPGRVLDEEQLAQRKQSIIDAVIDWSTDPERVSTSTWEDTHQCTVEWKRCSPDMATILGIADSEVKRLFPIVTDAISSRAGQSGLELLTSANPRLRRSSAAG